MPNSGEFGYCTVTPPPEEWTLIVRLLSGSLRTSRLTPPPLDDASTLYEMLVSGMTTVTPPPDEDALTICGASMNSNRTPPPLESASATAERRARAVIPPPLERRCNAPSAPSTRTPPPEEPMSCAPVTFVTRTPPPLARILTATSRGTWMS
jgi:hypothetical protein